MEKIGFFKMHAAGNDYVFVDARKTPVASPEKLAVFVSKRRFSVGGDGLVLIEESHRGDCGMRIFNADGSEGLTCGNALRCVAKYLYESSKGANSKYVIETRSGLRNAVVHGSAGEVSVSMGKAEFRAENIPSVGHFAMPYGGKEYFFTAVSVGNPHAVAFIDDLGLDALSVAGELSRSGIFPCGVNVEFVTKAGGGLKMRVIERGSGETLCCGSGACAAASAACLNGILPFGEIKVTCVGGEVKVRVDKDFSLTLTGGAEFVFKGELFYEE